MEVAEFAGAKYDINYVKKTLRGDLTGGDGAAMHRLDIQGYLELYLWPHYNQSSCDEHALSIMMLMNEKIRNNINIIEILSRSKEDAVKLEQFLQQLTSMSADIDSNFLAAYVLFYIYSYQSLELTIIRSSLMKYLSLSLWDHVSEHKINDILSKYPQIKPHWQYHLDSRVETTDNTNKKNKKVKTDTIKVDGNESTFIPNLIKRFFSIIENKATPLTPSHILFLERFLELLIDLLSQLATRRFLNTLLIDFHFIIRCQKSHYYQSLTAGSSVFTKLLNMLNSLIHIEIDEHTGKVLSNEDIRGIQSEKIYNLQQIAFIAYKDKLRELVFSSIGELKKNENIRKYLSVLNGEELVDFAVKLNIIGSNDIIAYSEYNDPSTLVDYVTDVIIDHVTLHPSQLDMANSLSLYPNEKVLFNIHEVPLNKSSAAARKGLGLPKLNLQFLTIHDYLFRNFNLYRIETASQIRDDIVDVVKRMGPKEDVRGNAIFGGWSKYALPILSVSIEDVARPKLGEIIPSRVVCSVTVDLSRFNGDMRQEWEDIKQHDVLFLVVIEKPEAADDKEAGDTGNTQGFKEYIDEKSLSEFPRKYGVKYIRGGEVFEIRGEDDTVLNDYGNNSNDRSKAGNKRRFRLKLDCAQYHQDIESGINCYEGLNLLIRRDSRENNFKATLETIRNLMNMSAVGDAIPRWLHDVFLGYGNPAAANYRNLQVSTAKVGQFDEDIDYLDTFLDFKHLVESFPSADITGPDTSNPPPPYRLKIKRGAVVAGAAPRDSIHVEPYASLSNGPYEAEFGGKNNIRYTPAQVEAIRSGSNNGLTLVIGPPGTGKTDTTVQIISNLYHNYPNEKILIVTHSNAALNDIFEKITRRDIDPRHLLRLGSGERDLFQNDANGSAEQFTKQGRVNYSLLRRIALLSQVTFLGTSMKVTGDVGYTCETAGYFYSEHVKPTIYKFHEDLKLQDKTSNMSSFFPFNEFFADAPSPIFTDNYEHDADSAEGCIRYIQSIFNELNDYKSFELLRTQTHRSDYLLTKQARIVAMTCTHAAINRKKLTDLGFQYDSIIMEEAAQVLEVETLIPMLLQNTDHVLASIVINSSQGSNNSRLKRVTLVGDHFQLPPIIQHMSLVGYSKFDQSLFTRLIRLGVPAILLDQQGRARPEIAALYNWRYNSNSQTLANLPTIYNSKRFKVCNPGLLFTYQLINVEDFQGKGETAPTPYFYQNLGEAEYVVAVYQYMRLRGYPANKISILTTYNGQKHLINDVIHRRCKHPLFGRPGRVSTVDKYQGQQNDYVLLSLVRTESVGHLRDIRRLIVALSRARFGLYIFCRHSLFSSCPELKNIFNMLTENGKRPNILQLVNGEEYNVMDEYESDEMSTDMETWRTVDDRVSGDRIQTIENVTRMGVLVYEAVQGSKK